MARPQKSLTSKITLRMSDRERAIVYATQNYYAQRGVRLSQNDVIRHLMVTGAMPPILTRDDARDRIVAHWDVCPSCTEDGGPKCAMGVWLRDRWRTAPRPTPSPVPMPTAEQPAGPPPVPMPQAPQPPGPPPVPMPGIGPFGPTFFPTNPYPRST